MCVNQKSCVDMSWFIYKGRALNFDYKMFEINLIHNTCQNRSPLSIPWEFKGVGWVNDTFFLFDGGKIQEAYFYDI